MADPRQARQDSMLPESLGFFEQLLALDTSQASGSRPIDEKTSEPARSGRTDSGRDIDEVSKGLVDGRRGSFGCSTGPGETGSARRSPEAPRIVPANGNDGSCHDSAPESQQNTSPMSKQERARLLNRQAQQRYRARWRAGAAELEAKIKEVHAKLAAAQAKQQELLQRRDAASGRNQQAASTLEDAQSVLTSIRGYACAKPARADDPESSSSVTGAGVGAAGAAHGHTRAHHVLPNGPPVYSDTTTSIDSCPPDHSNSSRAHVHNVQDSGATAVPYGAGPELEHSPARRGPRCGIHKLRPRAPRALATFQACAAVSYDKVAATAARMQHGSNSAGSDDASCPLPARLGLRSVISEYRKEEAARQGAAVEDIAWFVQSGVDVRPGVQMAFTSILAEAACVASYLLTFMLLCLQNAMVTERLKTREGFCRDLVEDENQLETSSMKASFDPKRPQKHPRGTIHTAAESAGHSHQQQARIERVQELAQSLDISEAEFDDMCVCCGLGDHVPLREAVRYTFGNAVGHFVGRLNVPVLRRLLSRFMSTQEMTLRGLHGGFEKAVDGAEENGGGAGQTDGTHRRMSEHSGRLHMAPTPQEEEDERRQREYAQDSSRHIVALAVIATQELQAIIDALPSMEEAERGKPRPSDATEAARMSRLCHAYLAGEALVVQEASRTAFSMLLDSLLPFMPFFEVDDVYSNLFKSLKLTDVQSKRMARYWHQWVATKRSLTAAVTEARHSLLALPPATTLPPELAENITLLCSSPRLLLTSEPISMRTMRTIRTQAPASSHQSSLQGHVGANMPQDGWAAQSHGADHRQVGSLGVLGGLATDSALATAPRGVHPLPAGTSSTTAGMDSPWGPLAMHRLPHAVDLSPVSSGSLAGAASMHLDMLHAPSGAAAGPGGVMMDERVATLLHPQGGFRSDIRGGAPVDCGALRSNLGLEPSPAVAPLSAWHRGGVSGGVAGDDIGGVNLPRSVSESPYATVGRLGVPTQFGSAMHASRGHAAAAGPISEGLMSSNPGTTVLPMLPGHAYGPPVNAPMLHDAQGSAGTPREALASLLGAVSMGPGGEPLSAAGINAQNANCVHLPLAPLSADVQAQARLLGQHAEETAVAADAVLQLHSVLALEVESYVDNRIVHFPGALLTVEQLLRIWSEHVLAQAVPPDGIALCQMAANQQRRFSLFQNGNLKNALARARG